MEGGALALADAVRDAASDADCDACLHPEDRHHRHTCSRGRKRVSLGGRLGIGRQQRSSARLREHVDSTAGLAGSAPSSAASLSLAAQLFDAMGNFDAEILSDANEARLDECQHRSGRDSSSRQECGRQASRSRSRSISPGSASHGEAATLEEATGVPVAASAPNGSGAAARSPSPELDPTEARKLRARARERLCAAEGC